MQRARTDRPFVRVSAVVTAIGAMLMSLPPQAVHAQTTAAAPAAPVRDFDIAAGSLASSLIRFGEQAGVQFTVPASLTAGKQAPALKGRYTAEGGLRELLSGSGLAFRFANPQTVVIEAAPQGDRVLGPVRIEGVQAAGGAGGGSGTGWGIGPNGSSDVTATEGTKSYAASAITLGGKSPTAAKDVPQTVSVITRKQMEDQNLVSITDVMKQTPGISVAAANTPAEGQIYSRGYAITSVQIDGGAPLGIGTGSPNSQRGDIAAVYDHVEVLRGADGIFDGMGQPSGTINLVRKKPLGQYQFTADASVGSWQNYRTALDVTGPLAFDGKLRGRLVGAVQDQKYFYDNARSGDRTLYGILEFDASPSTLLTLGSLVQYSPSRPFVSGLAMSRVDGSSLDLPRTTSFVPGWNRSNLQQHEVFGAIEQRFGADWSAKLNVTELNQTIDFLYAQAQGAVTPSTGNGAFLGAVGGRNLDKQTLIDLTVNGKFGAFGRQHDVTFGYSRTNNDFAGTSAYNVGNSFPFNYYTFDSATTYPQPTVAGVLANYPSATITQTGAYAKTKLRLTDRLTFGTGVRWSRYESDQIYNFPTFGFSVDTNSSEKHSSISFAALSYDVSKQLSAYASYADIFQDQSSSVDTSGQRLKPITGRSFELGAKFESADKKLNASAALFWAKRNNLAVYLGPADPSLVVAPGTNCCYYASPDITETSKGLDLAVAGEVLPRLQLTGGYTLNFQKRVDNSVPGTETVAPIASVVPRHLLKLWADYKLAGDGWWNRLSIGGGVNAQSSIYAITGTRRVSQGGYAVEGVRAAYDVTPKWRVALNIDNLLDRVYYQSIGSAAAGNWYGTPRSFMLSLHGKFD